MSGLVDWSPDSDYEIRKTTQPQGDIFPLGVLGALGALEGKTSEGMAESLLEEEYELKELESE